MLFLSCKKRIPLLNKVLLTAIQFFLSYFIFCSSQVYAVNEIVTEPRTSYWVNYFGKGVGSPTIDELVDVVNEYVAYSNSLCVSGWCSDALYSKTVVKVGSDTFYVGENMGTQRNTSTGEVSPAHVVPMAVVGGPNCYWPFASRTNDGVLSCVYKEIESNACGVGNPIDIATGIKYEQEVDYASADGALKVERFYVNQNVGWTIDQPFKLYIVQAGSTLPAPQYAYKQVVEYTKSILDATETTYKKFYYPRLFNSTAKRVVYVWLGRKMMSFNEASPSFYSNNIDGAKFYLQELGDSDIPNAKWKLVLDNKDTYYFSETGTVLKAFLSDSSGVVSYEYTDERLTAKVDQKGRRLTYAYDTDGRLVKITLPDNNTITYTYGSDNTALDFNFLKKVSWSTGESVSYLYNESANVTGLNPGVVSLTGKLDANGTRIGNYKYNGQKAISTERYNGIEKKQLSYSSSTTVTDALNSVRTYNFYQPTSTQLFLNGTSQPAGSGCSASTKYISYYLSTNLKKVEEDFNKNKQQFAYDMDRKLETVRVEGIPSSDSTDYLPDAKVLAAGIRKISTQWHSQWRIPVKKAEPKLLTTLIYNGDVDPFNGNQIANCSSYISTPLLCHKVQQATTDTNGQSGLSAVLDTTVAKRDWLYTYNAQGQLLTTKRGDVAVADEVREYYGVSGADYRAGDLKSITNASGHTTQFTAYDANGYAKNVVDANNVETQFMYDARGRLLNQTTVQATTSHAYDNNGNRIKSTFPGGLVLNYEYDPAKRLTSISTAAGDKINYEYDLESNLRFERITNAGGTLTYSKEHVYDALSREKNLVNSFNLSRNYLYDANGNSTGETDAKSHTTSRAFDSLNQLKQSTNALNGITNYSYDKQGHITEVKDPKGHSTLYTYNAFGELVTQVSPDTGTTTFSYDTAGNRTSAKDARGVVVNYNYDALNRLTSVSYPASPADNITYTYDSTANGSYGVGRLSSITTSNSNIAYTYNHLGLITQKRTTYGSITASVSYAYDVAGNLSSITYPSGRIVTYLRDSAGRIQSMSTKENATAAAQSVVSNVSYMPFGPASSYLFGNGLSHLMSFDSDYRVNAIQVGGVLSRNYTYDNADNIAGIGDAIATTKSQIFTYDNLDRLTSANGVYGYQAFSYDAVGNRTGFLADNGSGILSDTYNYDTASNRLTSINKTTAGTASGTRNFSYDAAGNTTTFTSDSNVNETLAYNNAGRLTTVKNGSTTLATYSYNALGQRIIKTAGTTQELYVYDEAGQLIAVTNAAGQTQREYIYRDGQLASFVTLKGGPISAITFTANAAVLQNAAYSKVQTGYNSSSGYIQFNGEGQFTWTANIISPATYAFYVRYSLVGTNRPLAILVDGVQAATMNFNPTADWNTWTTTPVNLTLTAGSHSITLKTTGNSGPNIDQAALQAGGGQTGIPVPTLYYSHNDHNGTPQVVTNQSKQVVWAADYQAFGKVNVTTNTVEIYSRFPGQVSDSETGLYYNWHRFYDPSIGRYIESDPIGLKGGLNTYAYVSGNPVSNTDPMGLVQMCHRDLLLPIPYARHCYLKYDDGSTSSYDPKGVNPDPDQNQKGTVCTTPKDEDKDDCIKKEMQKCDGAKYNFTQFNCCHCAEQAMKACGVSIPPSSWPNWPINPGPQPGEPNYSPVPKFDANLGK